MQRIIQVHVNILLLGLIPTMLLIFLVVLDLHLQAQVRLCFKKSLKFEAGFLNDLWRKNGTIWTWMSGDNRANQTGAYGIRGVADVLNTPGARSDAASWVDSKNNLWLFGGIVKAPASSNGLFCCFFI